MSSNQNIYIFVEKNLGHGFETIYPILPQWKLCLMRCLIKGCRSGFSRRMGFLLYHKAEIDHNCPDPRARGRSPLIEMTAVFPWKFEDKYLFSETANKLLQKCWDVALTLSTKGKNAQMTLELPETWYKHEKEKAG